MRPVCFALLATALASCAPLGPDPATLSTRAPGIGHDGDGLPRFGDAKPHPWDGVAPWAYPVHGVDVSKWQGPIAWGRVRTAGVDFAFIKATEGGDMADERFRENWEAAGRAGVMRGAYHFYYFCRPAAEQARWFMAHVPRERGALPPVLDMEWNHASRTCPIRPAPATVRAEMRAWKEAVGAHYGRRPIIYTSVDFYRDNALWQVGGYEFWLRSVAGHPEQVYPGQRWTFWQYTGTGRVAGIDGPADINAFAGSRGTWNSWLASRVQ